MPEEIVKFTPSLSRFLQTIDAFRAKWEEWPTEIVIGKEPYKVLTKESFTPAAWKLVEAKLRIILCTGPLFVALGDGGAVSEYNWDYKNEGLPASEWIGIRRQD